MNTTPPSKRRIRTNRVRTRPKQRHVRANIVGDVNAPIAKMHEEVLDMKDVLMGRKEPPIATGMLTLMEVADAYFSRACEMAMEIQYQERVGTITRGSNASKFRTGELRTFTELCKRAVELGSRRVTFETLRLEAERTGRESRVNALYPEDTGDE